MDLTHEQRLTSVEERAKSNSHRLDEIEKRQNELDELVSAVNVLAVREQNVENDVKEIKSDVKTMMLKPAKRWDGAVEKAVYTIMGIVLAYLASQIGM